jgi:DNA gyrase/topoisomerase IV subunit A
MASHSRGAVDRVPAPAHIAAAHLAAPGTHLLRILPSHIATYLTQELVRVQDESDRRGMRIAIEVKRAADSGVVLNTLLRHTRLQSRFAANMVALVNHRPVQMTLKGMLQAFIDFRVEVR